MNKETIYTVNIEGNNIAKKEILKCVNMFKEIRDDNYKNPELSVIAKNEIINFDFSLIGHFILFKKALPNIKIKLFLLKNKPYKDDLDDVKERSVLWKLRQTMVHSYYSTNENIFSVIDRNGEISDVEFGKNSWFVLSRKVLPLIFLNKKNYKSTFETPLNFIYINKIVKSKVGSQKEEEIYQECRRYLFSKKNNNNYIQILSQLAFYRALQAAKILRYYLIKQLA